MLLQFLLLNSVYANGNDWRLVAHDESGNISVFYRTHQSGNIEFRGVTLLNTSLSSLVVCLKDTEAMPSWVYNMESATVLKRLSEREAFTYVVNKTPFPFSKRDSIVHTIISQDEASLAVTIKGEGVPSYLPRKEGLVRLPAVNSYWKFTPLKNGVTKIVFQGFGEPGGNIPASISKSSIFHWATEKLLWKLPMESLKNLKTHIQQKKYQNVQLSFITES